jgi:hypothetical protein
MRKRKHGTIQIEYIEKLKIRNSLSYKAHVLFDSKELLAMKAIDPCLTLTN